MVAFKSPPCSIERTDDGVRVSGELDLNSAPELRAAMVSMIDEGRLDIVVDLTETTFLDSTALGVLAGRFRDVRSRGGSLTVICVNENVLYTLEVAGVAQALRVCGSRDELELA